MSAHIFDTLPSAAAIAAAQLLPARVPRDRGDGANPDDAADPHAARRVFTAPLMVRFLDRLALCGDVRASAAKVGISRETAYRARRRDPRFSALWDAALVHARVRVEAEVATRALDGVEIPVFLRGEKVASWQRHDNRLLLAHLARLDAKIAGDPTMQANAARFDTMLAALAGHPALEEYEVGADANTETESPAHPDCEAHVAHAREEALAGYRDMRNEIGAVLLTEDMEHGPDASEDALAIEAECEARAEWTAWAAAGDALLERVLSGADIPTQVSPDANGAERDRFAHRRPAHRRPARDPPPDHQVRIPGLPIPSSRAKPAPGTVCQVSTVPSARAA